MKNCRLNIFLLAALGAVATSWAKTIDPETALKRAFGTQGNTIATRSGNDKNAYGLKNSVNTVSGSPAVYIFGSETSSLLLSAEDSAPAVLGIIDSGISSYVSNREFDYWVNKYAEQIEWLRENPGVQTRAESSSNKEEIAPLLTTKWGQGSPFNNLSPMLDGERSWAGCVATAMSQVMNYHEWPEKGTGSHTYEAPTSQKHFTCDFASTTFDWANMIDSYRNNQGTPAQKDAVASLLYACAVSVDMDFSPEGSGAWSENVPYALVNYFGYDKGLHIVYRSFYKQQDWNDLVYDQLKTYGPVYYAGSSDDGAHAFVCDGYKDGYYHINWGWDGDLDGYYLLSALFPGTEQGAGGSTGAYNFDQIILAGVQRPQEWSEQSMVLLCPWGYEFDKKTIPLSSDACVVGWFMNYSNVKIEGDLALIIETPDGKTLIGKGSGQSASYSYEHNDGGWYFYADLPDGLAEGEYVVTPGFRLKGSDSYEKIPVAEGFPSSYIMKVSGGQAAFVPESVASLSIYDMEIIGRTFLDKNVRLRTTVTNDSKLDYEGVVMLSVRDDEDNDVAHGKRLYVTLAAGESMTLDYDSPLFEVEDEDLEAGTYKAGFVSATTGEWLSDIVEINFESLPPTEIRLDSFAMTGDKNNADPSNLEFVLKVSCMKGYFIDKMFLTLWTYPQVGDAQYVMSLETEQMEIEAGKSAEVKVKGALHNPVSGTRYIIGAWYADEQYGDAIVFTVTSSGIEDMDVESVKTTEVFDLSGVRVASADGSDIDLSRLPKGTYILRTVTVSGKITARRVMVN